MKFTPGNAKQIPELLKDMLALQREARYASPRPKKTVATFLGNTITQSSTGVLSGLTASITLDKY